MAGAAGRAGARRAVLGPIVLAVLALTGSACGGTGGTGGTAAASSAGSSSGSSGSSGPAPARPAATPGTASPSATAAPRPTAGRAGRLAGRTVVLDPGHQAGNATHAEQVARPVDAGNGVRKPCNTGGTGTNGGYPESRLAMRVALATKARLEAMGARVVLTRPREDRDLWGPCIDVRGRVGNRVRADAVVSIHADGAAPGARGFHVIRPAAVRGWTADIAAPSRRLAVSVHDALRARGVRPATYVGSRDGYDVRSDLGTLNWSDRPTVMVELGNMRSPADAALLTSARWQDDVAGAALAAGVADFLDR